jgi:hypothetical protein
MACALTLHIVMRQSAKLGIDDGGEAFQCSLVSVAPGAEQLTYVVHNRLELAVSSVRIVLGLYRPACFSNSGRLP